MQPGPIYAITDPALLPAHQLVAGVAAALRGGVRTVQYRDKTAGHAERLARAKALLQVCNDGAAALIINDDVELAAETGAHGVHLGQGDGSPALARQRLGPAAIIGVTCHANLQAAEQAATDKLMPLFTSESSPIHPYRVAWEINEFLTEDTVYIGDGGLGVPQRDPDTSRWYLQAPGMTSNGHHVHLLEFSKEKIKGTAISLDRKALDQFEIVR